MYHVYSLLVKPKYSVNDVKKINQLCKMHIPGNFKHYCLTDDLEQFAGSDFCELINVKEYRLDTWWNKLLLFKQGICPKNEICLFFDLDSSIVNSLAPILSNYNGKLTLATNPHKITSQYLSTAIYHKYGKYFTMMNSSFMMWKGDCNIDLWEKFAKDPDYYSSKYILGNDQFMTYEYENYHLLSERYITDFHLKRMKLKRPEAIVSLKEL
jgi:hypothetical protein